MLTFRLCLGTHTLAHIYKLSRRSENCQALIAELKIYVPLRESSVGPGSGLVSFCLRQFWSPSREVLTRLGSTYKNYPHKIQSVKCTWIDFVCGNRTEIDAIMIKLQTSVREAFRSNLSRHKTNLIHDQRRCHEFLQCKGTDVQSCGPCECACGSTLAVTPQRDNLAQRTAECIIT